MSIPSEPPTDPSIPCVSTRNLADFTIRAGVPAIVGLLFAAVLLAEDEGPDHDLQIVAPPEVMPGRPIPLRAIVIEGMAETDTPRLLAVRGVARLEDSRGRVLASVPIRSATPRGAAVLLVPTVVSRGAHRLTVRAETPRGPMVTRAEIAIRDGARPLSTEGRALPILQSFHLFDVRSTGRGPVPSALEARVVGGACVPEELCEILVWVGAPGAALTIEPSPAAEPIGPPSPETSGLTRLVIRVHGPEAEIAVVARRAGVEIARRKIRLPVVQGAPVLHLDRPLVPAPARPRLVVKGELEDPVFLDAYRDGRWERTATVPANAFREGPVRLPGPALAPGAWRLEVRTDPWSRDLVASRMLWVHATNEASPDVLRSAARDAASRGSSVAMVEAILAGSLAEISPADALAFLAAEVEADVIVPPPPIRGRDQLLEAQREKLDLRHVGAVGIFLCGWLVSGILFVRALRAEREARRIARLEPTDDTHLRQGAFPIVGAAFFLLLVFGTVAFLVVSRGVP